MSASAIALDAIISLLILQLGDSRYFQREKAHKALAALLPLSATQLERALSHSDMEVRGRAWLLVRPHIRAKIAKQAYALRDPFPWLCLHCPFEQCYWVDLAAKQGTSGGGPDWQNYRDGCRLWAAERLIRGATVQEVERQLEWMAREEVAWRERYLQR